MNQKIEKLLSIISMPKEEQYAFLNDYFTEKYFKTDEWPQWYGVCDILIHGDSSEQRAILTTLAFELRNKCQDPFGWCAWDRACWEVWSYFHVQQNNDIAERKHLSQDTKEKYCLSWMSFWAESIHQLIAALITKEIVADPEEKFDAHLTEEKIQLSTIEKLKKVTELLGKALSIIDDIQPIVKSPVCDQLCEIGEDIDSVLTKLSKLGGEREVKYGIAQDKSQWEFWAGPNPSLKEILEVDGRDENSAIWRFNADGTDDLIYRWGGDVWIEVNEED